MIDLKDAEKLLAVVKRLTTACRQFARWSEKQHEPNLTQRRAEKIQTELNWRAMEIDQISREAHAVAVDCGIADTRSAASYQEISYHPSGWHHYTFQTPKPRVDVDRGY